MPNFKGHLFGGLTTFTLLHFAPGIKQQLSPVFSFQKIIELYLSFLGSIAPDIDIYSHGRKIFDFFVLVGCIAGAATKKYELIALLMGSFFVAMGSFIGCVADGFDMSILLVGILATLFSFSDCFFASCFNLRVCLVFLMDLTASLVILLALTVLPVFLLVTILIFR